MGRPRPSSVAVPKTFIIENRRINENHKHMTIKISMAAMNLKSFPKRYGTNVIDDLEFILLYDYSQSR